MEAINPFSTRFLQPGAKPYLFEDFSESEKQIVELSISRCESFVDIILGVGAYQISSNHASRWSIIGPHGTGKSTLIYCLIDLIQKRQVPNQSVRLSTEQRYIKNAWRLQSSARRGIFVVDGYEQLSIIGKLRLCLNATLLQQRLLITAHSKMLGFKVLYKTKRTGLTDELVVRSLLSGTAIAPDDLLNSSFWQSSKQKHGQNLRESLFDAYDWYEQKT